MSDRVDSTGTVVASEGDVEGGEESGRDHARGTDPVGNLSAGKVVLVEKVGEASTTS